jgi:hypothetical protein
MRKLIYNKELFIRSEIIKDNQTWNTCPICYKDWKDLIPIPGLLHRTRICDECFNKQTKDQREP